MEGPTEHGCRCHALPSRRLATRRPQRCGAAGAAATAAASCPCCRCLWKAALHEAPEEAGHKPGIGGIFCQRAPALLRLLCNGLQGGAARVQCCSNHKGSAGGRLASERRDMPGTGGRPTLRQLAGSGDGGPDLLQRLLAAQLGMALHPRRSTTGGRPSGKKNKGSTTRAASQKTVLRQQTTAATPAPPACCPPSYRTFRRAPWGCLPAAHSPAAAPALDRHGTG